MRKKSSYSEENFFSANSAKVSEYFRQNPRLPKKMKSGKPKYPCSTVRTVGQLSCGGKNMFSASPIGIQNLIGGEPLRNLSEHDNPWSKLHRTFSNNQSPRNFPHAMQHPLNEPAHFCSITEVKPEGSSEPSSQEPAAPQPPTHKTESGVQVNMFHCKECRRHIKYGKVFKLENSCTESDSENQLATIGCSNCERKQDMISLPENVSEDEEKSENEEQLRQHHTSSCSRDRSSCDYKSPTPRDHPLPTPRERKPPTPRVNSELKIGNEVLQGNENSSELMKVTYSKGGSQSWLTNIKLMTFAIVVIPLILHLSQIQNLSITLSNFSMLRNILTEEETEEHSVVGWVIDLFFGVQGYAKPLPLFLYLF